MYGIATDERVLVGPFRTYQDATGFPVKGCVVAMNHPCVANMPKRAPWEQIALSWPIR